MYVDASWEHFRILHKLHCSWETLRLRGVLVDPKLTMEDETNRIRKKTRPKIQAILQNRAFYDTAGVIQQYKSHVLCLLAQPCVAIRHAAQAHLDSLGRLQRSFIRELGLSDEEAFLAHQLAPLELRRDISALGLLHKIQLGEIHADFNGLFPKLVNEFETRTRRGPAKKTFAIKKIRFDLRKMKRRGG